MNKFIPLAIGMLFLSACQTTYVPQARDVKKKPRANGVIAMPTSYRPEDRIRADELMRQNCAGLVVNIVDEGEAVVGQATKSNTSATNRDDTRFKAGNFLGLPVIAGSSGGTDTEASSVTTQVKEWQVTYNCDTPEKGSSKAKR